MHVILKIITF